MAKRETIQPEVTIQKKPEMPTHFWLSEKIATINAPGKKVEIDRAITNPFIFIVRGENAEAEIDLTDFMKSISEQVMYFSG